MTFLLDVNVLIALIDSAHVSHDAAHRWFGTVGGRDWATCPMTENAVVRFVGQKKYPNTPGSPAAVTIIVGRLRTHPGHTFWSDDLSIASSDLIDPSRLLTSAQVTDSYLLALALAHGGHLATFDRRLSAVAVRGGTAALHQIGPM